MLPSNHVHSWCSTSRGRSPTHKTPSQLLWQRGAYFFASSDYIPCLSPRTRWHPIRMLLGPLYPNHLTTFFRRCAARGSPGMVRAGERELRNSYKPTFLFLVLAVFFLACVRYLAQLLWDAPSIPQQTPGTTAKSPSSYTTQCWSASPTLRNFCAEPRTTETTGSVVCSPARKILEKKCEHRYSAVCAQKEGFEAGLGRTGSRNRC